jgi:hypothetical protein
MPRLRNSALAALLAMLAACNGDAPAQPAPQDSAAAAPPQRLGLMTSLPLYWPLGAGVDAIASGGADLPWQRVALEQAYTLVPLDTLSPIPALSPDAPDLDPLAGLTRLAVIQPRGLSPADNVALDKWVREGGRLLLVLDPVLTGEYDLPLGDPRRPVDSALIPPVVARWGMAVRYDDTQSSKPVDNALLGTYLPLILWGEVEVTDPAAANCTEEAYGAAARCRLGRGEVFLIADATIFENPNFAGEDFVHLHNLLAATLR